MGRQALDVVSVASVMSLCLTLRVVEDHEAGHVVADLPRGEAVEVGPAVLPSVAVRPLEAGADVGGLHLQREVSVITRSSQSHLSLHIVVSLILLGNIKGNGTASNSDLNCIFINLSCLSCTNNINHTSRIWVLKVHLEN